MVELAKTIIKEKKAAADAKSAPVKKDQSDRQPTVSEILAQANYVHIAPQKVRLVVEALRGKPVSQALDHLRFVTKRSVTPLTKLINSAVANGENNFGFDKKDLFIKRLIVNPGPVLKRYQPHAHGRSTVIRKRSSHIILVLGVKAGAQKRTEKSVVPAAEKQAAAVKVVSAEEAKKLSRGSDSGESKVTAAAAKSQTRRRFLRQVFSRKTG